MLIGWVGAFPGTHQSKLISPNTAVKRSSHFPHFHVAHAGVHLPSPQEARTLLTSRVSPSVAWCHGMAQGLRACLLNWTEEKGDRVSLTAETIPPVPLASSCCWPGCSGPQEGQAECFLPGQQEVLLMASQGLDCFVIISSAQRWRQGWVGGQRGRCQQA